MRERERVPLFNSYISVVLMRMTAAYLTGLDFSVNFLNFMDANIIGGTRCVFELVR